MNKCDNCPNNCCGNNFIGLANSFKHSNGDLFNQILLSEEEVEDIVKNFGDEYIEYVDNMPFIALNEDRSCKAFKNGRCSIYKSRPDVCKLYPYYFDPFGGIFIDKNCAFFEENEADKKDILALINKRIKLFATLEGKKQEVNRLNCVENVGLTKRDLLEVIESLDFLEIKNNKLFIENIDVELLIREYGSPLAIAFVDIIERRINELKKTFNAKIRDYNFGGKYHYAYATKANYFSEVVYTASKHADMLEFSSEYDIDLLLKMLELGKFDCSKSIICNGFLNDNYFSKIKKISSYGIKVFVVIDDEIKYDLLKKYDLKNIEICLRYNCQKQSRMSKNNYDNFHLDENRFGLTLEQLESLLQKISIENKYNCSMILFHFGGEINNLKNYLMAFETVCDLFANLKTKYKKLEYLDIGGGFPSRLNSLINIESLVDGLVKLFKQYSDKYGVVFDIIGEHGRYTTEEHGVYLFKIQQLHNLNNQHWAIINNSLMKCIPDLWGLHKDFIFLPINHWDEKFNAFYLAGTTCDEDDRLFVNNKNKHILLPNADEIYIAVLGIGAYQEMISGDSCFSHCMIPKSDELVITKGKKMFIKNNIQKERFKRLSYTKQYLNNFDD